MPVYGQNEAIQDWFLVLDSQGNPVTGLVQANFTIQLLRNEGATAESVTITEKGAGYYWIDFTPTGVGTYSLLITNATYNTLGWTTDYKVTTYSIDDIGTVLARAIGLMQENTYIDNQVYDINNHLVSARIRTYTNAASVGTGSNVLATYDVLASYTLGLLTAYSVIKQ